MFVFDRNRLECSCTYSSVEPAVRTPGGVGGCFCKLATHVCLALVTLSLQARVWPVAVHRKTMLVKNTVEWLAQLSHVEQYTLAVCCTRDPVASHTLKNATAMSRRNNMTNGNGIDHVVCRCNLLPCHPCHLQRAQQQQHNHQQVPLQQSVDAGCNGLDWDGLCCLPCAYAAARGACLGGSVPTRAPA